MATGPASSNSRNVSLRLSVVEGPDAGLERTFEPGDDVTIGRDTRNTFVLNDGFVSGRHGEVDFSEGGLVYRDLRSRHGSQVLVEDVSMNLQGENAPNMAQIQDGAEIQVGCTVIEVELISAGEPSEEASGSDTLRMESQWEEQVEESDGRHSVISRAIESNGRQSRETMVTTALRGVDSISNKLDSSDKRFKTLFRLAGELNGLTSLEEVMNRIVDAVFEAFPAANFFAVTLVSDPDEVGDVQPFMTRVRGELPGEQDQEEPILSTSIVRRVLEDRESVLFLKDSFGAEVSQSIIDAQITACLCAPLIGQRSLLGAMQVDTRGRGSLFSKDDLDLFSIFASNAAFALERAKLSDNIVEMFDSFVSASVNAIEARDPTTAGHSERVATYTLELADVVNGINAGGVKDIYFDPDDMRELRYAALLHDFGKIAVRERVLQKGKRLPELHLELIEQRFETIKSLQYQRMIRKHFGNASDGVHLDVFDDIEKQYDSMCDQLDLTLEFLMEVASAPGLTDEQVARVKKLGEQFFVDARGEKRPYLSAEEVENMTIRRGTLNDEEWKNMRSHARRSEEYLERIPWSDELADIPCIAGAHHEKLDGSGYPDGLSADEIVPQVRMLTISDIFDALTASDRPYRKAATPDRAVSILREEAATKKLDSELVEVFSDKVVPSILKIIPGRTL
ncbi:MAG: HD domain-containing phosphohydrolase [Myxococcota bacterium]